MRNKAPVSTSQTSPIALTRIERIEEAHGIAPDLNPIGREDVLSTPQGETAQGLAGLGEHANGAIDGSEIVADQDFTIGREGLTLEKKRGPRPAQGPPGPHRIRTQYRNADDAVRPPRRLVDEQKAADHLNLPVRTLQRWRSERRANTPPFIRAGRAIRYDLDALDQWLDRNTVTPTAVCGD